MSLAQLGAWHCCCPLAGGGASRLNLEDWAMGKTRNVKDLMNPDIMTVADEMTTDELAR